MQIQIPTCKYTHIQIHTEIHTHTHTRTHTHTLTHTHTDAHAGERTHADTDAHALVIEVHVDLPIHTADVVAQPWLC